MTGIANDHLYILYQSSLPILYIRMIFLWCITDDTTHGDFHWLELNERFDHFALWGLHCQPMISLLRDWPELPQEVIFLSTGPPYTVYFLHSSKLMFSLRCLYSYWNVIRITQPGVSPMSVRRPPKLKRLELIFVGWSPSDPDSFYLTKDW